MLDREVSGAGWLRLLRVFSVLAPVTSASPSVGAQVLAQGGAVPQTTEAALERQWGRQHLLDELVSEFRQLAAIRHTPDYEKLKPHKAGAICIRWGETDPRKTDPPFFSAPFFGEAWEYDAADQAERSAMAQCEKARVARVIAVPFRMSVVRP